MYQDSHTGGGGGSYAPVGLMSSNLSSSGQYKSSAPRSVPTASQGPVQRTGSAPAPARKRKPAPKKKKAAPAPKVPGINQFLAGDTTYNDQASQLRKQLEQFRTSNQSQQGMVAQDFQSALDKMLSQKDSDLKSIQNDYAARGLLNSGLYTDAVGQYDQNYQQQFGDLNTGKQRSLSDLLESLANYQTENTSSLTAAKQDAIRRRAQKYGITT
jgi:hypothetical protein